MSDILIASLAVSPAGLRRCDNVKIWFKIGRYVDNLMSTQKNAESLKTLVQH